MPRLISNALTFATFTSAATQELVEVARRVRARFPDLAARPPMLGAGAHFR